MTAELALRSVASQEHCSIADSFGTLGLESEMDLLIQARWLHRPPLDEPPTAMPGGWEPVRSADSLNVQGEDLARARDAGFADIGPQLVWFR